MAGAVAEVVAELDAEVVELGGLGVAVPGEPSDEVFEFEAPTVFVSEGKFDLEVGCEKS